MSKLTITEALSELHLIKKKIEKKRTDLMGHLISIKGQDPITTEGGSKAFVASEVHSINDLQSRFVLLKNAIAKANIENQITVGDQTKSIHEWLIWKRDLADAEIYFTSEVYKKVKDHFDTLKTRPQLYKDVDGNPHLAEFEQNVDQIAFLKKNEALSDAFQRLDGQLSLKNATVFVEA